MRFKDFLLYEDDPTAWGGGGSFSSELGNIKGELIEPISQSVKNFKRTFDKRGNQINNLRKSKKEIKTKNYQARDKNIKSGLEGQINNAEMRLSQIRDKIINIEKTIGRLKENSSNSKSPQQKEALKRQVEGYNNQLKVLHKDAAQLMKNRRELIERHNNELEKRREQISRQKETEIKQKEKETNKKDEKQTDQDIKPEYDPFEYGIEKPVKPDLPDNWSKFTEQDVNKLKNYYNDLIEYNEKVRKKTSRDPKLEIRGKTLDYAEKIMNLRQEIKQLEKDWEILKSKRK